MRLRRRGQESVPNDEVWNEIAISSKGFRTGRNVDGSVQGLARLIRFARIEMAYRVVRSENALSRGINMRASLQPRYGEE